MSLGVSRQETLVRQISHRREGPLRGMLCCIDVCSHLVWARSSLSREAIKMGRILKNFFCNIVLVGAAGPVATELLEALTGVQQEKVQDSFGWVVPVV